VARGADLCSYSIGIAHPQTLFFCCFSARVLLCQGSDFSRSFSCHGTEVEVCVLEKAVSGRMHLVPPWCF